MTVRRFPFRPVVLLALLAVSPPVARAQDTPPNSAAAPATPTEAPVPVPEDPRFIALIQEAQSLHSSQKHFDALQKLDEAELLQPTSALIPNVRGSIYTAMRDFDKARTNFAKAEVLSPQAFEPKFNLVELDYVQGKFAEAETGFSKLLNDYPKLRQEVRHLTQFKVLVCRLKQDKVAEAREIMKGFSFMDDTPAYYYSKAAFDFQEGKKNEGRAWLGRASGIYKQPALVPYLDSLMEARWVDSLGVADEK